MHENLIRNRKSLLLPMIHMWLEKEKKKGFSFVLQIILQLILFIHFWSWKMAIATNQQSSRVESRVKYLEWGKDLMSPQLGIRTPPLDKAEMNMCPLDPTLLNSISHIALSRLVSLCFKSTSEHGAHAQFTIKYKQHARRWIKNNYFSAYR